MTKMSDVIRRLDALEKRMKDIERKISESKKLTERKLIKEKTAKGRLIKEKTAKGKGGDLDGRYNS